MTNNYNKTKIMKRLFLILITANVLSSIAQTPIIDEWILNTNGKMASYWQTSGMPPSTSYTFVQTTDSADVLQVCYSSDSVWIRCNGMTNDMGKYQNPGTCVAMGYTYRFPRNPTVPSTKYKSPVIGEIGALLNGIPIYGLTNATSWNGSTNSMSGQGIWNTEVYTSEGFTLDTAFGAHPQQSGAYHTHATPFRFYKTLATNVHSPIVGFAFDGFPVYGPYGYSDPTNASSGVTRMRTGYSLRNITSRTTLPDGSTASQTGPPINSTYPLGSYMEDYEWLSTNGDLDEYNGRFCVTPEYPSGTYAYFVTIDASGNQEYPYYIGPYYYGEPVSANSIYDMETVSIPSSGTSCSTAISINLKSEGSSSINIYPNPNNGTFNIGVDKDYAEITTMNLYNQLGQKVFSTSIVSGVNQIELPAYIGKGIYLLSASSSLGKVITTKRIIVE